MGDTIPAGWRKATDKDDTEALFKEGRIAEMCTCGHLNIVHLDRVQPGQGACIYNGCGCPQFTWAYWVVKEAI